MVDLSPSFLPRFQKSGNIPKISDTLVRYEGNTKALAAAQTSLVEKLDNPQFTQGFGSNGGEAWEKWDKQITQNLNRIQNEDGSWAGHHCITGRTFCTSAALLVLTVDRAPVPVAAEIHRR